MIKYKADYVGVIVFGQFYLDAYLQEKEKGSAEIIHIVIGENYQRNGHGINASVAALKLLQAQNYENIFVAAHPDNSASENLFKRIGFQKTDRKNYDSDPLYKFVNDLDSNLQSQK